MRNTISTTMTSLIPTFLNAMRFIIRDGGVSELEGVLNYGNASKSQIRKTLNGPDGTYILFGAFDNADKYAGTYAEVGSFNTFFIDEPMAKNVSDNVDYQEQEENFYMIKKSIFRGKPIGLGKHEIPNEGNEEEGTFDKIEFEFRREVFLSMNPGEEKHGINTKLVEPHFTNEEGVEYVSSDLSFEDHYKKEKVVEKEFEGIGKEKTLIVKMTKFINEHTMPDERLNDLIAIREGDPFSMTATLGFFYEGGDPSIYVYRIALSLATKKELDPEQEYEKYTWGLDFGKKDKTALVLKGGIQDELGVGRDYRLKDGCYKIEDGQKRNFASRLEICRFVVDGVKNEIVERYDILEKPNIFNCDEKGEVATDMLNEELIASEIDNFSFMLSSKKGYPIVVRQDDRRYRGEMGLSIIDKNGFSKLAETEGKSCFYGTDGELRDEKKNELDFINAEEYADEPMRRFFFRAIYI